VVSQTDSFPCCFRQEMPAGWCPFQGVQEAASARN
jgi:hypothetical protein